MYNYLLNQQHCALRNITLTPTIVYPTKNQLLSPIHYDKDIVTNVT